MQQTDAVLEKLYAQHATQPLFLVLDFDGTVYTAGKDFWKAPIYNRKTSSILQDHHIPLTIITGRHKWDWTSERLMRLLGLRADIVIYGGGSVILHRGMDGILKRDMSHELFMQNSKFTWIDEENTLHHEFWNRRRIIQRAKDITIAHRLRLFKQEKSEFVVRYHADRMPFSVLEQTKHILKEVFPQGVKILMGEALFGLNTTDIYSGDILLVPETSGKDNAVAFILKHYAKLSKCKLHAIVFGDSSIDISMLMMKENSLAYSLSQYGVHLAPHTLKVLKKIQPENPHLVLNPNEGPQVIYEAVRKIVTSQFSPPQLSV